MLTRRNKPSSPCTAGNYDEKVIQNAVKSVGCRPPLIKVGTEIPICTQRQEFYKFGYALEAKEQTPPCKAIKSIYDWYKEYDHSKHGWLQENQMLLRFQFVENFYKEVIYLQEYTIETLIGNTGGYIGTVNKKI